MTQNRKGTWHAGNWARLDTSFGLSLFTKLSTISKAIRPVHVLHSTMRKDAHDLKLGARPFAFGLQIIAFVWKSEA